MRVSVVEGDSGRGYRVLFNGIDITKLCVMADEEAGEVHVHIRDGDGRLIVDRERKTVLIGSLLGRVKVRKAESDG